MTATADRLTLDEAARLLGARREGRGYRAPCPVHGGDGYNLAIDPAADGDGPVFFCHSHGCDSRAILAAVRERAGAPASLSRSSARDRTALGVAVASYVYRDAGGAAVGEVRRYEPAGEPKTFRQYGPDGRAGAPPALRSTPYNLPAVAAAIAKRRAVFVVEGEKDVETLAGVDWQLAATCNAMGAGKWTAAHAAHLAGATSVVILPDNDEPGREHAAQVARTLLALDSPPRVRIVTLPGVDEKGDATDWACAGGTPAQLVQLAKETPLLVADSPTNDANDAGDATSDERPAPEADAAPSPTIGTTAYPQAVRLLGAPDESPPAWLVRDLIPKGEPVLLVGPDGSMKSTLALHLACAVAAGGRVFEHGVPVDAAPVLVVSGEDPRGVVANRCAAIARGHGWNRERVLGNVHVLALAGTDLTLPSWRTHLVAELARIGAALIILDPLADLASGDENDNTERRAVVATWRALAATGATPVLVHHAGKAGDGGRSKRERIRGASAIAAASRCTFFVEQSDAGVTLENLKQSRAEKVPAFVVAADIVADATNRAVWVSARFTRTTQRKAARTHAETVVIEIVGERPGMTSTELREAIKGRDVAIPALNDALDSLSGGGHLTYDPGARGAKHWRVTDPVQPVPTLSDNVAGRSPTLSTLSPLQGTDRVDSRSSGDAGQGAGDLTAEETAYLADERAALEDVDNTAGVAAAA